MKRPNVLLIHADQLRFDCISPYGNRDVKTPALDALARDSAVYQNHYCSFPVCTPSRYSLLSGQYSHQHLGWGNHSTFPSGLPTFPKLLRKNGWKTAAVGKMHFTPTYLDVGFDRMVLSEQDGPGRFDDDYHRELKEKGLIDDIDIIDQRGEFRAHASPEYFASYGVQVSDLPEEMHSTSWVTRQALKEIDSWQEDTPNLLMAGYIKPHHPFDPPARYAEMYDPDSLTLLPGMTESLLQQDTQFRDGYFNFHDMDESRLRRMLAYYYACITHIDDGIGEMIKLLKKKGMYENTMIIFTSDHGDFMGFHHLGLKGNHMYEPLVHVPLLIHYPNSEKTGSFEALNSNVDVAAEVLRTCGLPVSRMMSSHSLDEGRPYVLAEEILLFETRKNYCYMIRDERYKLLVEQNLQNGMLFDLERDPLEMENRWDDPALAEQKSRLFTYFLDAMAFDGGASLNLDEYAPVNLAENALSEEKRQEMKTYFMEKSGVGSLVKESGGIH